MKSKRSCKKPKRHAQHEDAAKRVSFLQLIASHIEEEKEEYRKIFPSEELFDLKLALQDLFIESARAVKPEDVMTNNLPWYDLTKKLGECFIKIENTPWFQKFCKPTTDTEHMSRLTDAAMESLLHIRPEKPETPAKTIPRIKPPVAKPAPEPKHELLTLGSYAKKFIKEVDLTERIIVFTKKSSKPLYFNDRAVVRQILELTLGPKANPRTGWVELPDELRKWKVEFRAPIKLPRGNQVADPHHDLTKLLHHIESDAKLGRPKGDFATKTNVRFCRDILPGYQKVLADYNAAINGALASI